MAFTRHRRRPLRPAALLAACVLAGASIAACGGSSSPKGASAGSTSPTSSASSGLAGAGGARFAALRTCMRKEGITLPQRPPGSRGSGGAGGPAGGTGGPAGGPRAGFLLRGIPHRRALPKGISAKKFQAALKKCDGGFHGGGFRRRLFSSAAARKALTAFAACMRENGIKLPAPNTSGQGPVFDTEGIDVAGTRFKKAEARCAGKLPGPFAGRGGSPPPSQAGGA